MYAVCKTDIGQMRSTNQDVACCGTFEDGSAWSVVCDGMGGVNGGNVASGIASAAIVEHLKAAYTPGMEEDAMREMMLSAVQGANDAVIRLKTALGIKQVTTDHSYVQQLVESGAITEDEARVHPQRNLITRVVGVHPELECDYGCFVFEPGDVAVSCTDGLSNYLERDTLLFFISNYAGEQLAEELVQYANSKGGSDNITVAVIENR